MRYASQKTKARWINSGGKNQSKRQGTLKAQWESPKSNPTRINVTAQLYPVSRRKKMPVKKTTRAYGRDFQEINSAKL